METEIIIKNTVIIGAILGLTFLSQQPYFRGNHVAFNFPILKKGEAYVNDSFLSKTGDLLKTNPYASLSGEVSDKTANLTNLIAMRYIKTANKENQKAFP